MQTLPSGMRADTLPAVPSTRPLANSSLAVASTALWASSTDRAAMPEAPPAVVRGGDATAPERACGAGRPGQAQATVTRSELTQASGKHGPGRGPRRGGGPVHADERGEPMARSRWTLAAA